MLYHLLYVSDAASTLAEDGILDILAVSREFNQRNNITGLLLYKDRSFIQLLEGEKKIIGSLYANIEQDPRHSNVKKLILKPVSDRYFPNWSMGFKHLEPGLETIDGENAPDGLSDFMNAMSDFEFLTEKKKADVALKLLLFFREN